MYDEWLNKYMNKWVYKWMKLYEAFVSYDQERTAN